MLFEVKLQRVDQAYARVPISRRADERSGPGTAVTFGADKRGRVEPLIQRASVPDASHNGPRDHIRTRRTGGSRIHRITRLSDAYGEARSELENAVEGPAA